MGNSFVMYVTQVVRAWAYPGGGVKHTLEVTVLEAEDLITVTLDEELCDPFCSVKVGQTRKMTSVAHNTFAPVWHAGNRYPYLSFPP